MFNKTILFRVIISSISFLFFLCFSEVISKAFSSDDELSETSPDDNTALHLRSSSNFTYNLTAQDSEDRLFTKSYRPTSTLTLLDNITSGGEAMTGGAIIGKDKRIQITNTNEDDWKVHGQLIMIFNGKDYTGTGTLVSPYHVLTAGHNLYNYDSKTWAESITFYAGRNGTQSISGPVECHTYRVFYNWLNSGSDESDMGIITLEKDIGNKIGWNGLLWGKDEFLSELEEINVSGYPGDKELGTMWTDRSKILEVKEKQFTYTLSTFPGESGANPWIKSPRGNYYSLGTHASGVEEQYNIATRLTQGKLQRLVKFINEGN